MKQRYEFWELFDLGEDLAGHLVKLHHLRRTANDLQVALEVEKDYSDITRKLIKESCNILDEQNVIVVHSHFDQVTGKMAVCFGMIVEHDHRFMKGGRAAWRRQGFIWV